MTLFSDELSGDVRHVTCTCSLLLSFSPFSSPILLPPRFLSSLPASPCLSSTSVLISTAYVCLSLLCIHVFLALFLSVYVFLFVRISRRLFLCLLSFSLSLHWLSCPTCLRHPILSSSRASCSHCYDVFRSRKLSSFHNRLSGTIRQQFVPTVKTRDCNSPLRTLNGGKRTIVRSYNINTSRIARNISHVTCDTLGETSALNYCKLLYPIFSVFNNVAFL